MDSLTEFSDGAEDSQENDQTEALSRLILLCTLCEINPWVCEQHDKNKHCVYLQIYLDKKKSNKLFSHTTIRFTIETTHFIFIQNERVYWQQF